MMASGKWVEEVSPYNRAQVEAYLALKGYVPVCITGEDGEQRVGLRAAERTMQCLVQDNGVTGATLVWYTGLTPYWSECAWSTIPPAVLHNMWGKWRARYES